MEVIHLYTVLAAIYSVWVLISKGATRACLSLVSAITYLLVVRDNPLALASGYGFYLALLTQQAYAWLAKKGWVPPE